MFLVTSGSNGVDCDLDGANHIVDFKTLQGLSHYDNTSTIPGATLEKRQKAVNKEYHDRTRKLDSELHGSQQDQRGPIESELNEYGHRGRVLAPVIGRYGGASSDLSLILDLVAREMARKHTAFQPKTCSDRSLHANGVTQLLGDGRLFF